MSSSESLLGKVYLVTGGTEGIGRAAARALVRRGAEVVIVGRDPEKTARVMRELSTETGAVKVDSIVADLSRAQGAVSAAREFASRHDRLDGLINNAGAVFDSRRLNADGVEMTFALNHLAYHAMTTRLLPILRKTPGARVVSTSSGAYSMGRLEFPEVARRERGYNMFKAYGDSKLANILFTRELARREQGRVIANCYFPGFVRTRFGVGARGILNAIIQFLAPLFARTPAKGAETLLWLATDQAAGGYTGEYFKDRKVEKTNDRARDEAMARRLWDFCEELTAAADNASPAASSGTVGSESARPVG